MTQVRLPTCHGQDSTLTEIPSVRDIPGVVRQLTQGSPSKQAEAIDTYFTKDAVFIHPFCRVPRFSNSRELIQGIFRWYKIMSPHIDLTINSVGMLYEFVFS